MRVVQRAVSLQTRGRGFYDMTAEVTRVVAESGVTTGLCTIFLRHTSASLVIQENADAAVLRDLSPWMDRLAPVEGGDQAGAEGPPHRPAHLRCALAPAR